MGYRKVENPLSMIFQAQHLEIPNNLANQLKIHLSCENLSQTDLFIKVDAFIVLYLFENKTWGKNILFSQNWIRGRWKLLGNTEIIKDDLNPKFSETISMQYVFEEKQKLKVEIYHVADDLNINILGKQELIGN